MDSQSNMNWGVPPQNTYSSLKFEREAHRNCSTCEWAIQDLANYKRGLRLQFPVSHDPFYFCSEVRGAMDTINAGEDPDEMLFSCNLAKSLARFKVKGSLPHGWDMAHNLKRYPHDPELGLSNWGKRAVYEEISFFRKNSSLLLPNMRGQLMLALLTNSSLVYVFSNNVAECFEGIKDIDDFRNIVRFRTDPMSLGGLEPHAGSGFLESMMEWIKELPDKFREGAKAAGDWVARKVWDTLSIFGEIGGAIRRKVRDVIGSMTEMVADMVMGSICKKIAIFAASCLVGYIVGAAFTYLFGGSIQLIALLIRRTIRLLWTGSERDLGEVEDYLEPKGLSEADLLGGAIVAASGKFCKKEAKEMSDYATMLRNTVMTGALVVASGKLIFSFLPHVFKKAVIMSGERWGLTREAARDLRASDWAQRVKFHLAFQKTSKVLCSTAYLKKNTELYREGTEIITKGMTSKTGSYVPALWNKLSSLQALLNQSKYDTRTRDEPLSIHLCGDPGMGKTTNAKALMKAALPELLREEIYDVPTGSDYWDKCNSSYKAVFWDEFIVTKENKVDGIYLQLVSTGVFSPPLASLDSPSVGIKGESLAPKIVISASNDPYPKAQNHDSIALQRRRDLVIQVEPWDKCPKSYFKDQEKAHGMNPKNIPRAVLATRAHLRFRLLPRVCPGTPTPEPETQEEKDDLLLTWEKLCVLVKTKMEEKQQIADIINKNDDVEFTAEDPLETYTQGFGRLDIESVHSNQGLMSFLTDLLPFGRDKKAHRHAQRRLKSRYDPPPGFHERDQNKEPVPADQPKEGESDAESDKSFGSAVSSAYEECLESKTLVGMVYSFHKTDPFGPGVRNTPAACFAMGVPSDEMLDNTLVMAQVAYEATLRDIPIFEYVSLAYKDVRHLSVSDKEALAKTTADLMGGCRRPGRFPPNGAAEVADNIGPLEDKLLDELTEELYEKAKSFTIRTRAEFKVALSSGQEGLPPNHAGGVTNLAHGHLCLRCLGVIHHWADPEHPEDHEIVLCLNCIDIVEDIDLRNMAQKALQTHMEGWDVEHAFRRRADSAEAYASVGFYATCLDIIVKSVAVGLAAGFATFLSVIAGFYVIIVIKKLFFTTEEEKIEADMQFLAHAGGYSKRKTQRTKETRLTRTTLGRARLIPHAGTVDKNRAFVSIVGKFGKTTNQGVFLKDQYFVTYAHSLFRGDGGSWVEEGDKIIVTYPSDNQSHEGRVNFSMVAVDVDRDLVLFDLRGIPGLRKAKDITKNLPRENETDEMVENTSFYTQISGGPRQYATGHTLPTSRYPIDPKDPQSNTFVLSNALGVRIPSAAGDCGSTLTGFTNSKVYGILVAGTKAGTVSIYTPVTQEWFEANKTPGEDPITVEDLEPHSGETHVEMTASHRSHLFAIFKKIQSKTPFYNCMEDDIARHDLSKYSPEEMKGYQEKWEQGIDDGAWPEALDHHYTVNDHHPEYFLKKGETPGWRPAFHHLVDSLACIWERKFNSKSLPFTTLLETYKNPHPIWEETVDQIVSLLMGIMEGVVLGDIESETHRIEMRGTMTLKEAYPDVRDWPNLVEDEIVPENERVYMNTKSKIRPSPLSEHLPDPPTKELPLLSQRDPRGKGARPDRLNAARICQKKKPRMSDEDLDILDEVGEEYLAHLENRMKVKVPRRLTIEEAVAGLPGLLKGMDRSTSMGYPGVLNRSLKGKQDLIALDEEGTPVPTDRLRKLVAIRLKEIDEGQEPRHRFLGSMKDELMKKSKINEARTRLVWAADAVDNVVFRMHFGGLLQAFISNWENTSMCIGLNAMSHDMQMVKDYLDEVKGNGYFVYDFKDWDRSFNPDLQNKAYEIIGRFGKKVIKGWDDQAWTYFVKHQTRSKLQIGANIFIVIALHISGLFLTTPANCAVHSLALRFSFKKLVRALEYDKHVRDKTHGDDGLVKPSFEAYAAGWTPLAIQEIMAELGLEMTSDVKEEELSDKLKRFEDITFLGAHPRKIFGAYTGALKKSSLTETPHWDRGMTDWAEVCVQLADMATGWGKSFYESYTADLRNAYQKSMLGGTLHFDAFHVAARRQADRTTESGASFNLWLPLGEDLDLVPHSGMDRLTHIPTPVPGEVVGSNGRQTWNKALQARPVGFEFATSAPVERGTMTWNSNQQRNSTVMSKIVPWGLLDYQACDTDIQNQALRMYTLITFDAVVTFRVNPTPFYQGGLRVYFRPLSNAGVGLGATGGLIYMDIDASDARVYGMRIPFRFNRHALNTFNQEENLGSIVATVLSPLSSAAGSTALDIPFYVSYENFKGALPRPAESANKRLNSAKVTGAPKATDLEPHGASQSTTNISVNDSVVGDIATGTEASSGAAGMEADADVAIPLDNTMVAGGGVPMYPQLSGFSKGEGQYTTQNMSLHPKWLARTDKDTYGEDVPVTNFRYLGNLFWFVSSFKVTTANNVNDMLWSHRVCFPPQPQTSVFGTTPLHAICDLFKFWRGDPGYRIRAFKTKYHTFALRIVLGYAVPDAPVAGEQLRYISFIITFQGDHSTEIIGMPYTAATEFLETYDGGFKTNPIQDTTLGFVGIYLANKLTAPDNVSQEVELIVEERLANLSVSTPKPVGIVNVGGGTSRPTLDFSIPAQRETLSVKGTFGTPVDGTEDLIPHMEAASPKTMEAAPTSSDPAIQEEAEDDAVVSSKDKPTKEPMKVAPMVHPDRPCKIKPGDHLEYLPSTFMELWRRPARVYPNYTNDGASPGGDLYSEFGFTVDPSGFACYQLFAGWRGGIRFRFVITHNIFGSRIPKVLFYPNELGLGSTVVQNLATIAEPNGAFENNSGTFVTSWENDWSRGRPAFELALDVSLGRNYVDVVAPFQSIKRFLTRDKASGVLAIILPRGVRILEAYKSAGDDFTMGIFSGTTTSTHFMRLENSTGAPVTFEQNAYGISLEGATTIPDGNTDIDLS